MTKIAGLEDQISYVDSFRDLVSTSFRGNTNAICWARPLAGDFAEIVAKVEATGNITELGEKELNDIQLSEQGQLAREELLNDLRALRAHGASPVLNLISSYDRDDDYLVFPTDVYSFHVDRSPVPTDTFLCTYHGEPSDIVPNAQAKQKVLIPELRTELRNLYDGPDEGFESFLTEYFFDLHYQAEPQAGIISLGVGHLWKLAIDHPESQVLPCLHRAPQERNGQRRLLMIC